MMRQTIHGGISQESNEEVRLLSRENITRTQKALQRDCINSVQLAYLANVLFREILQK
jgi:hypothetical protein